MEEKKEQGNEGNIGHNSDNGEHHHSHEHHEGHGHHHTDEHPAEEHKHHEAHHEHHPQNKSYLTNNLFLGLVILLGIILLVNIFLTVGINNGLDKAKDEAAEKSKPASIELTVIKNSKCADCFDISPAVDYIKSANVNVAKQTEVEFDSDEGKNAIGKYGISRVPSVIVTGEIGKVSLEGLEKKEDALLLSEIPAPYTDALTGEIRGRVALIYLKDKECPKCADLTSLITGIQSAGVSIASRKEIESKSAEGMEIISKYRISFIPTLILSKDAADYAVISQAWQQIGSIEGDGSHVLRAAYPPYINLTTGKLKGIVNIAYLTDKSCTECYDVNMHRQILVDPQGFAIKLEKEETIDISEPKGKELLAKYNITKVPTVVLSGEISAYPSSRALQQFFFAEKDGSYVFKKAEAAGTYRDLETNKVVKAQEETQQ